jgi:hypothetical protein
MIPVTWPVALDKGWHVALLTLSKLGVCPKLALALSDGISTSLILLYD